MKLFNVRIPIHETADDLLSIHDLIGILSAMLDQHKVTHFVSLASKDEQEKDKNLRYQLHYLSEQNTELTLIVALFMSLYLKRDKQKILESIVKSFGTAQSGQA